ncbi:hypothetical protein CSAL01_01862 [Colletotrichum salicis]|uniref:Uncharacterized protein n=1 Tax=Colletotrichum salicis TaxID=1209931 RepID=A0A135V2J9_9PEZI|nr:hypothetical protein CSAL01_01862 [Colletotrichum salicis]
MFQTPKDIDFTLDTTYPSVPSSSFMNEVTPSSSHGTYTYDLRRHTLHHGLLDGRSHINNGNVSRSPSYTAGTWPVAGRTRSEYLLSDLDLSSASYSIDNLSAHTSQLGFQATDAFELDLSHAPQGFFAGSHIIGNPTASAQRSSIFPLRQNDYPNLIALGIPNEQSFESLGNFDFSIDGGPDDPFTGFFSDLADNLEHPPRKNSEQLNVLDRGSQAPLTLSTNTKRARDESDSDDSSTPRNCPFCESFRGDTKRLRFEPPPEALQRTQEN